MENIERDKLSTFSSILDPRIKDTCFQISTNKRQANSKLFEEVEKKNRENKEAEQQLTVELESEQDDFVQPQAKRPKFDMWEFVIEQQEARNSTQTMSSIELDNYLKVCCCLNILKPIM